MNHSVFSFAIISNFSFVLFLPWSAPFHLQDSSTLLSKANGCPVIFLTYAGDLFTSWLQTGSGVRGHEHQLPELAGEPGRSAVQPADAVTFAFRHSVVFFHSGNSDFCSLPFSVSWWETSLVGLAAPCSAPEMDTKSNLSLNLCFSAHASTLSLSFLLCPHDGLALGKVFTFTVFSFFPQSLSSCLSQRCFHCCCFSSISHPLRPHESLPYP